MARGVKHGGYLSRPKMELNPAKDTLSYHMKTEPCRT